MIVGAARLAPRFRRRQRRKSVTKIALVNVVSQAIAEAARAASLEELGACAFPALARALGARPVFLGEVAQDFASSQAVAGEHRAAFRVYMRDFVLDDPIGRAALSSSQSVHLFDELVDRKLFHASRAYADFHRHYDFEHHLLIRFYGARLPVPGALVMGLTRGRQEGEFGQREARIARLALPAFRGAAERIQRGPRPSGPPLSAGTPALRALALERGLTPAETAVLESLALGLTNSGIAGRLCVSVETVKTHLYRVFKKLGVTSRAQALVFLARQ
jgi:DNA-binding CsgD family transcriptional regulator